ncbi:LOW QUALITY PROTEIN: prominin-2 [Fundulus diaphanus]
MSNTRPCGSARGWPHRAAEATMLLLVLSLARSASGQPSCQAAEPAQNLTQPQYSGAVKSNTNADFLMPFVRSFLYTVQPHPFPEDLILKIIKNPGQVVSNQEKIKEILVYEVGFLVCIAIGILYIFLMPIIGLFMACCRCCGNCGGKMYQKQTSSIHCLRRTLYFSVFGFTIIIFAGNICMFRSNEALKVTVDQSPLALKNTIGDIHLFLASVPQAVDNVVSESHRTVEKVTRNLDDIGRQVGGKIQQRFKGTLYPALQSIRLLHQVSLDTSDRLNKLNSSLAQLQSSLDLVQANVSAVRDRINQTLSKPDCNGCHYLKEDMQTLTVDTTISVPSLHEFQSAVDEVVKADLQAKVREAEECNRTIPQKVTNETKDLVQKSKQQLDDIKQQISKVSSELRLSDLNNVTRTLNQVQHDIDSVLPEVKRAESFRWSVGVFLCCVVLLVVTFNILGLVLGPLGLSPMVDPTNRSSTSNCGGIFLMMGAGFSFLFSWLFMILVLLLFLLGGNMHTLICRPWNDGQLLKFLDTSGQELGLDLGLKSNINISDIYRVKVIIDVNLSRDCDKNQPLWTTLHLYELVDLGELLNVSKYTVLIQEQFESTDITLSSFNLLSPEIKKQLADISAKATNFNSTAVTQQASFIHVQSRMTRVSVQPVNCWILHFLSQMNNILRINLNTTADKIDLLARNQSGSTAVKDELQSEALKLRQIQADIEVTIFPQVTNLNSSIKSLQSTTSQINGTAGEALSKVGVAQDFLNTNTTQIVKTESRSFLDCQVDYFTVYIDWAKTMVTQQLGRCRPVARAVDSVEVVLCVNMVESLNAFWFSLGWCLMFFIPSIIASIKLAKYYRRMKYSDFIDNHITMNHIPRAQFKIT